MEHRSLKDTYITRAIAPIEDADAQEEIALELSAHLDERIEFYKEIGYDDETAEKKAIEDMGDPEPVGESLSKLHPKEWVGLAVLALLPLPFVPFLLFLLTLFFSIDAGLFPASLEALLLIYLLALSRYGQKRGNRFLCAAPVCVFILSGCWTMVQGASSDCSALVIIMACLLTGDFTCLRTFPVVGDITVAPWLHYATVGFYFFLFLWLLASFISVCRMKKSFYGRFTKRANRALFTFQRVLQFVFIALTLCTLPAYFFADRVELPVEARPQYFETVIVAQGDAPVDQNRFSAQDVEILSVDYDFSRYVWLLQEGADGALNAELTSEWVTIPCGDKMQYGVDKYVLQCDITKPYVYVSFGYQGEYDRSTNTVYIPPVDAEDWQQTETVDTISVARNNYTCLEIVINDARA